MEKEIIDVEENQFIKKGNKKGLNVFFPEQDLEDFYDSGDGSDEESVTTLLSGGTDANASHFKMSDSNGKAKMNLFQRILGYTKKEKERNASDNLVVTNSDNLVVTNTQGESSISDTEANDQEPINILRIYAGNVDLKATYKTVALTNQMTIKELLAASLRRFRVPESSIGEYYLSVLHMDSQERKLDQDDSVLSVLENLRSRHLPGVRESKVSHAVMGEGRISKVRQNDDKIIRFIVNKQLNIDKNHLIRVILFDERDSFIRTYKTIVISQKVSVEEIVKIAIGKFQLLSIYKDSQRRFLIVNNFWNPI
ncbi:hypothetical protein HK096_008424 [Nowakowskiella sp. JEL0078]|nr:hypothetical protein HK096_008424 [Nowakowskiella sp. JEL0078]